MHINLYHVENSPNVLDSCCFTAKQHQIFLFFYKNGHLLMNYVIFVRYFKLSS